MRKPRLLYRRSLAWTLLEVIGAACMVCLGLVGGGVVVLFVLRVLANTGHAVLLSSPKHLGPITASEVGGVLVGVLFGFAMLYYGVKMLLGRVLPCEELEVRVDEKHASKGTRVRMYTLTLSGVPHEVTESLYRKAPEGSVITVKRRRLSREIVRAWHGRRSTPDASD